MHLNEACHLVLPTQMLRLNMTIHQENIHHVEDSCQLKYCDLQ